MRLHTLSFMDTRLVTIEKLSEATSIPVRTLRTLYQTRKIPVVRAGHRTLLFSLERVTAALERLEIKAVAQA